MIWLRFIERHLSVWVRPFLKWLHLAFCSCVPRTYVDLEGKPPKDTEEYVAEEIQGSSCSLQGSHKLHRSGFLFSLVPKYYLSSAPQFSDLGYENIVLISQYEED